MAQILSLEVSTSDITSKVVDSEAGPALSLGLSFKLAIPELLHALSSLTGNSKQLSHSQAIKPKGEAPLSAAMQQPVQPGLIASPPQNAIPPGAHATSPPTSASLAAPPPEEAKDALAPQSSGTAPPVEATSTTVTWSTPLDKLQPNREEYSVKARWDPSPNKWELLEQADLSIVKIQPFDKKPLVKKVPTPEPNPNAAKKAEEAFKALESILKNAMAGPSDSAEARKSEDSRKPEDFPPLTSASPPKGPPPPAPGNSKERTGNGTANATEVAGSDPQEGSAAEPKAAAQNTSEGARPDVPPMPSGPPPAPPSQSYETSPRQPPPKAAPSPKGEGGKECKQQ